MGVRRREETKGCTMLPPLESEYAVEPVGVEMMRPSATARVRGLAAMEMERRVRWGEAPRWIITSLRAWVICEAAMGGEELVGRWFVGVFVGEGMTETLSLLRRRTRAVRWVPRAFPRMDDQPSFSDKGDGSAFSSKGAVGGGETCSPRRGPRSPRLAPDM